MKNPIVLGAIGLGLLAAVVTFVYVKKKNIVPEGPPPKATYVVAKEALYPRIPISEDMIESVTVEGVQDAAFLKDISAIRGKSVRRTIAVGEKIRTDAISASATTFPIPDGLRAIPLFFDPKQTTAGLLNVGDKVDVLVVYVGAGADATDAVARTVAQNCEVISLDVPGAMPIAEGRDKKKAKSEETKRPGEEAALAEMVRVVVAVTPDDAVKITAATERGDVRLSIRNPENALHAKVEEEWEHPHRKHSHYPNSAPASSGNRSGVVVPGGEGVGGPRRNLKKAAIILPQLPAPTGVVPRAVPSPPSASPAKTVQVVKGTQVETVTVPE